MHRTPQEIQDYLITEIARVLGVPRAQIDPAEPLADYGIDSVAALELTGGLEQWLGRELPSELIFDYPSIALLAKKLGA